MRDVPGTVYLIHFVEPYKHARHYLGFTTDLEERLAAHRVGRGARLMGVIKAAGIDWKLSRTWQGTRALERQIKNTRHVPHYCPECQPERNASRREARQETKETSEMDRTTVGDLVQGMQAGKYTREAVIAALKPLSVIAWDVEVERPEPVEPERELEAG